MWDQQFGIQTYLQWVLNLMKCFLILVQYSLIYKANAPTKKKICKTSKEHIKLREE